MLEIRKAGLDYQINAEKVKLEYDQALLAVDRERDEILKKGFGITPDLQSALDAKRTQAAKNRDDEMTGYEKKQGQDTWNAQQEYALTKVKAIRDAAGHIFDDMLSGSQSIWKDLLRSFENIFLAPVRMAFQNLAVSLFSGMKIPGFGGGGGGMGGAMGMATGAAGSYFGGGTGASTPFSAAAMAGGGNAGSLGGGWGGGTGGGSSIGGLGGLLGGGGAALGMVGGLLGAAGLVGNPGAKAGLYASSALVGATGLASAASGMPFMHLLAATFTNPYALAAVGLAVGITLLVSHFRKSAEDKARQKIKSVYGIDIQAKGVLTQIVEMAKQSFGGNLDMAIRSQQVEELVRLYGMSTGQSTSGMRAQMTPMSMVQSGAGVYSVPNYNNGLPGSSLSRISLPASGGNTTIQMDGPTTQQFLQGQAVNVIKQNPRLIQSAANNAVRSNYGRRELTSLQLSPGTLVS
jgi:hypothetical protein